MLTCGLNIADFEVDGGNGRCKICSTKWMRLGNLRVHEGQKGHRENVATHLALEAELRNIQPSRACEPDTASPCSDFERASSNYRQATVEDCLDESSGFSWYEARGPLEEGPSEREARGVDDGITAELRDALDGKVEFSTGESFAVPGLSDLTLEDVLGGAGLFEVIAGAGENECPEMDMSAMFEYDDVQSMCLGSSRLGSLLTMNFVAEYIPSSEQMTHSVFGTQQSQGASYFPYPDHGVSLSERHNDILPNADTRMRFLDDEDRSSVQFPASSLLPGATGGDTRVGQGYGRSECSVIVWLGEVSAGGP